MRLLFAFFLSLCLSFNAAHAAASDVCDALEGQGGSSTTVLSAHGEHIGHHVHDHAPAVSDKSSPADPSAQPFDADHCHPHPCFTSVIPGEMSLPSLTGSRCLPIGPCGPFVSPPPSRLERPPRAALA